VAPAQIVAGQAQCTRQNSFVGHVRWSSSGQAVRDAQIIVSPEELGRISNDGKGIIEVSGLGVRGRYVPNRRVREKCFRLLQKSDIVDGFR